MSDADAVINNSSQKVGGSNAYPDPAPRKWVGPDPEKTLRIYAPGIYTYQNGFHEAVAPICP